MTVSNTFVVVLKGPAAIYFGETGSIRITNFPGSKGPLAVVLQTRYVDFGLKTKLPRDLWIDVRGQAESVDEALDFANAAFVLVPLLSFAVNAAVGIPKVELAFENTPGKTKREFFQQMVPEDRSVFVSRKVRVQPVKTLVQTVVQHSEFDRLFRAISQYHLALLNWDAGKAILALAHLYMGIEALAPVVLRRLCRDKGMSRNQLTNHLGIEKKELDPTIRKKFIFQNDIDCYKQAVKASDAFEHGFKSFPEIAAAAASVKDKTAAYLRKSIVDELNLDNTSKAELFRGSYAKPLASWRHSKQLRGHLIGERGQLSAKYQTYPIMRWKSKLKSVALNKSGRYELTFDDTLTASLGEGISFQPSSFEVWGPKGLSSDKAQETDGSDE